MSDGFALLFTLASKHFFPIRDHTNRYLTLLTLMPCTFYPCNQQQHQRSFRWNLHQMIMAHVSVKKKLDAQQFGHVFRLRINI